MYISLNYNKILVLLVCFCFLSACEKEQEPTETYSYNAYFIYPKPEDKKVYVGTVTGLSSCKYIVSDYYAKRYKYIKGKWDYVCCLRTDKSECAEEHKYQK
jgi:hypothetical protein